MSVNNVFPTKGNLMNVKKSLQLARMGFDLLDRKRNILIRELMGLIDTAKTLRSQISATYGRAYFALQRANITMGFIEDIAQSIPIEEGLTIQYRSVMGVELPVVKLDAPADPEFCYGFAGTNSQLDNAYLCFHKVKLMTAQLAEIENCIYRLANAIKKTQSRANALKNIIIPDFEFSSKFITDALEEKEREEFSRLKVIKSQKQKKQEEAEEIFSEIAELQTDPVMLEELEINPLPPEDTQEEL
ncbi:MAG: V-type ATP synthase subunit D [Angelakisella sp.]